MSIGNVIVIDDSDDDNPSKNQALHATTPMEASNVHPHAPIPKVERPMKPATAGKRKGNARSEPDIIKITRELGVNAIIPIATVPDTWTVPITPTACLVDVLGSKALLTASSKVLSLDTFIRAEIMPVVAGCDMIQRGPLRFQKGEHRGGLEDCVQSDECRRVECGVKTIPSLAILSCIFRGALQENLISKNEAIDWMLKISGRNNISKWTSNHRDLYGIILMGNPVGQGESDISTLQVPLTAAAKIEIAAACGNSAATRQLLTSAVLSPLSKSLHNPPMIIVPLAARDHNTGNTIPSFKFCLRSEYFECAVVQDRVGPESTTESYSPSGAFNSELYLGQHVYTSGLNMTCTKGMCGLYVNSASIIDEFSARDLF
ncbi:hypothetical protein DFH09DRAFT_1080168 [Mycena vulgaris]|nr:hypothetical protein DFH09DRAFT_1080168 [Mycena vulgaris]